jgi:hypothetical protein
MKFKLNLREFERAAEDLGAASDQTPFALSVAMNRAVQDTRRYLIERTWPSSVQVRNKGFIRAALRMEFATKGNLHVAIFDQIGRGHLKEHAEGGTVRAKRGKLAIPTKNIRRTMHGVARNQKPRALQGAFKTKRGDAIVQPIGGRKRRGRTRKLRVMYLLRRAVRIKQDVPFHRDFKQQMREGMMKHLPAAIERAMNTRRR